MNGNFFRSDEDIANARMNQVLEAIQKQDKNALKDLFSKNAQSVTNFEDSLDRLFDLYQGDFQSYNDWGGVGAEAGMNEDGSGRVWKSIESAYDVTTSEHIYRFAVKEFRKDSADSNNIGIYSMYIMKAKESGLQRAYRGDGKWTPGITIEQNEN